MDSEQSEQEQEVAPAEVAQAVSPPWLAAYRGYLYFALVLSAFGLVLSATVWGGKFSTALLNVVVAAFVLKSLKRIGETWVPILHLVVNGATLIAAIAPLLTMVGYYGLIGGGSIQSLLSLFGVDFGVLLLLSEMILGTYASVGVVLVFALVSVYWLKNWFPIALTSNSDPASSDTIS